MKTELDEIDLAAAREGLAMQASFKTKRPRRSMGVSRQDISKAYGYDPFENLQDVQP